ncbi:MAG: dUTP diphosphatase [Candidatus Kerfeldbacteria bacterium]|nr:dUTP diphosphatase [Candidatus Kerfeldbacteria bacterium]
MKLLIKKLVPEAVLPQFAHDTDAGMDLYSVETLQIAPGERCAIKTGLAMHIPEGYAGLIWDKSGRALKEGLKTMAGVVDSGYRGEVQVVLINLSTESTTISAGQKIAQMIIQKIEQPLIEEVEHVDDTSSRGQGGFGSTGL